MTDANSAILEHSSVARETTAPAEGLFARLTSSLADPVVRKGAMSVFDQAIVSGTSFVTSIALGRLCSPAELGVYYLALSIVLFARGIQEQLVSAPYTVYCSRYRGRDLAGYTGSVFAHQFGLILVSLVLLLGFATITAAGFGPIGFSATAWVLIASVPFLLLREHIRQFAFARLSLGTAIRIDAVVAVLQITALAVLAWFDALSAAAVLAAMGGACALAAIGWWICNSQPVSWVRRRIVSDWRKNWSFAKWALASHLVGSSTPYVMPWFVAAIQGNAATGVMAACNTIVGLANSFVMGLSNYLTPKAAHAFANGGVPELRRVLKKTTLLFSVSVGGFCAVTLFAGNFLAVLIYGESYSGAGPVVAMFALALWAGSFAMTAGNGLWAMDKPSANFRADAVSVVATICAAAILTPAYGVMGAAVSTFVGAASDAVMRWWTLRRLMLEHA